MKLSKDIWFPAKTYGWGWGLPCAWQGWVVMIGYIAIICCLHFIVNPVENIILYLAIVFALTIALFIICWKKGEKPEWRWGQEER